MSQPTIDLYVIRHAESVMNNLPDLVCGRSPEADLSRLGRVQSLVLGGVIRRSGIMPDLVYSSPARRALLTARNSLYNAGIVMPIIQDERLHEVSQGDWSGEVRAEVHTPEVIARREIEGYDFKPPSERGESTRMAAERMFDFMHELVETGESRTVFAYGHGLVTRTAVGLLNGWPFERAFGELVTPNTSITKFRFDEGKWTVPNGVGQEEFNPQPLATMK